MKRIIHIEHYKNESELILYSLRWDGEEKNEPDRFFERFKDDLAYKKDILTILAAMKNLGRRGAQDRYLRPEDDCHAIPVGSSNLRLYCIKGHKYCLILGGGGVKSSQRVADSPDAFPHFHLIKKIEVAFREKMIEGEIYWNGDYLDGELILEIEP